MERVINNLFEGANLRRRIRYLWSLAFLSSLGWALGARIEEPIAALWVIIKERL